MGCATKKPDERPVQPREPVGVGPRVDAPPSDPIVPPIVVNDSPRRPVTVVTTRVSLQSIGEQQTDTFNPPLPPVFYVIVGRGPAATINHTTLLQSEWGRGRMDHWRGKLPVLHVGFANPWSQFFSHGMGQPTYLLGLPGFHAGNQPNEVGKDSIKDGGLTSTVFGACVDRELEWCVAQERERWKDVPSRVKTFEPYGWPVVSGWVAWAQRKGDEPLLFKPENITKEEGGAKILQAMTEKLKEPYPEFATDVAPYRLLVLRDRDGTITPELIYARFIDFCTGSGRPRQDKAEYKTARLEPWRDPATWSAPLKKRKIVVATEAVRQEFEWEKGQRVCVANGGAIALNAAERARDEECWTDWFHVTTLMDSFNNPRNFTFIKHGERDQARAPGEGTLTETELIAADERIRLGGWTEAASAVEKGEVVEVRLKKGVPRDKSIKVKEPVIRDYQKNDSALEDERFEASPWYASCFERGCGGRKIPSVEYHRLIHHTGLVLAEVGQPYHSGLKEKLSPLEEGGRMVGLQSGDGFVRVLGAAAQMYPELPPYDKKNPTFAPSDKMWQFRDILPVSAVPDGFILSGVSIAQANKYFDWRHTNRNINTMSQPEIEDALTKAGVYSEARDLATYIVQARNASNGYADAGDLEAKVLAWLKNEEAKVNQVVEEQVDTCIREYLEQKKETEKLKTVLTAPEQQKSVDELLELQRGNVVAQQVNIRLAGDRKKRELGDAHGKLATTFREKKEKIGQSFEYSY